MAEILKVEPQAGPHLDRQCRRLVRHEGGTVPRIRLRAACRARARPSGQMDRRAFGQLRLRQSRPRPRGHRRARARRRRHVPGAAAHQLRQHGRLPLAGRAAAVDAQRREERAERLPHAADRSLDQVRVHQHLACLGLSRRRPAGRQLLHGAADRSRRRRDRDRPPRAAPAQPHPAARDSAQDRLRHELRQRRLPGSAAARARGGRRQGLQPAQAREPQARQAARARHRQLPRGHRAAIEGDGRYPLRAPTAR